MPTGGASRFAKRCFFLFWAGMTITQQKRGAVSETKESLGHDCISTSAHDYALGPQSLCRRQAGSGRGAGTADNTDGTKIKTHMRSGASSEAAEPRASSYTQRATRQATKSAPSPASRGGSRAAGAHAHAHTHTSVMEAPPLPLRVLLHIPSPATLQTGAL